MCNKCCSKDTSIKHTDPETQVTWPKLLSVSVIGVMWVSLCWAVLWKFFTLMSGFNIKGKLKGRVKYDPTGADCCNICTKSVWEIPGLLNLPRGNCKCYYYEMEASGSSAKPQSMKTMCWSMKKKSASGSNMSARTSWNSFPWPSSTHA